MSGNRRDLIGRWLIRYGGAVGAVAAAFLLRLALTAYSGPGLPTYITFYPFLMLVALLGGFWPGLLATVTTALVVNYWVLSPREMVGHGELADAIGLGLFLIMGVFISTVAELYRRARRKAALYEKELELRESQDALRESRTQMSRAQEMAHLGSWELDLVRNLLTWSDEVYRIFGLQPQEFSATYEAFLDTVHPDDRAAVDSAYSSSVRERKPSYEIDHRIVRKTTGEVRWVHEKCDHVQDATGRTVRSIGMVLDITDRKLAAEELRQTAEELARSNEDLEQFAYAASHDLQEPLRAVSGFAQLLRSRYRNQLDAKADAFIDHIVDGTSRMSDLIRDLLAYSRVGSREVVIAPVKVQESLDKALYLLRASVEESGARITADPMPLVRADESRLVQLFENLIGNAIKFRSERPLEIHIGAMKMEQNDCDVSERDGPGQPLRSDAPPSDMWLFSVKDNGIGLEAQFADRIFMIFQRLHTRDKYPGTGIGLAICKKIVERHGGRIWVESKAGEGSTFFFTL